MTSESSRPVPAEITRSGQRDIRILWQDGHESVYAGRELRLECPCAGCVDEWTGERILVVINVPEDVRPLSLDLVGRYAARISWSDGHSNGIYTFEQLRSLCPCGDCREQKGAETPL